MAEETSTWKRPSDVMKLRRKKQSAPGTALKFSVTEKPLDTGSPQTTVNRVKKRKNPFGVPQEKRSNSEDSSFDTQSGSILSGALDCIKDWNQTPVAPVFEDSTTKSVSSSRVNEDEVAEESNGHHDVTAEVQSATPVPNQRLFVDTLPLDWSLKTKLRFVSPSSFSWCWPLKSSEEAQGVARFIQTHPDYLQERKPSEVNEEKKVTLQQGCFLWMHPNLPWLRLFPRTANDRKAGVPSIIAQDPEILKSLYNDWVESFTSVFHMLRANKCPYFYLCMQPFNVVFRAESVCGTSLVQAIVSPTSRGFREALNREDICFSMPLDKSTKQELDRRKNENDKLDSVDTTGTDELITNADCETDDGKASSQEGSERPEDDIEEVGLESDEGASTWLQNLGLDSRKFRSLDPAKVKLQREKFKAIDNLPESTVLVEDTDVFGLFNYLLNCNSCIAAAGSQTGIPPTILAPVAFKGATLKPLKVKQGALRQQTASGQVQQGFTLEVNGPILPHTVQALHSLFKHTHSTYSCTYNTLDITVAFNCANHIDAPPGEEPVPDHRHLHSKLPPALPNGKIAIQEVISEKGQFAWSTS